MEGTFVYSSQQYKELKENYKKIGKNYVPKTVIANGARKQYTELLTNGKKSPYVDAIVMAKGDLDTIKYDK